jgi:surfactin synthase thioesterase subunit
MVNYLRNFKNNSVKKCLFRRSPPAGGSGFSFQSFLLRLSANQKSISTSIPNLEIKMNNPKSTFNNLTASIAKEYAKIAKHFK